MGFASAAPAEYDAYLPDSEEFRRNTRSDGPYRIASVEPGGREIVSSATRRGARSPTPSDISTSNTIHIRVGKEPADVMLRMIDAGELDLGLVVHCRLLGEAGPGDAAEYPGLALNPYLVFNILSPNAQAGRWPNLRVRQAIASAVDKVAISRIFDVLEGVPNRVLHSVIPPGSVGRRKFDPYPTPGGRGDPARARRLLEDTGHGGGLRLVAAVRDAHLHLDVVRSVARDLARIGVGGDPAAQPGRLLRHAPARPVEGTGRGLGHRRAGLDPRLVRQQRPRRRPAAVPDQPQPWHDQLRRVRRPCRRSTPSSSGDTEEPDAARADEGLWHRVRRPRSCATSPSSRSFAFRGDDVPLPQPEGEERHPRPPD